MTQPSKYLLNLACMYTHTFKHEIVLKNERRTRGEGSQIEWFPIRPLKKDFKIPLAIVFVQLSRNLVHSFGRPKSTYITFMHGPVNPQQVRSIT